MKIELSYTTEDKHFPYKWKFTCISKLKTFKQRGITILNKDFSGYEFLIFKIEYYTPDMIF